MSPDTQRPPLFDRVQAAATHLREKLAGYAAEKARAALVLGSGLGGVTEQIETEISVPYREIPFFPGTAVEGHRGQLIAGTLGGAPVLALEGRVHGYEGYAPEDITFAVRVLAALGIESLVVTNASGGIREDFQAGDLVAIRDHINLTGTNAAAGCHNDRLGPRFFDMSDAYTARLRRLAIEAASQQGWTMAEGVYLGVLGPSFETPAEIRAFRTLGADLVGMSTVHEVTIARQCGIEILGISCVTNMAAGVLDQPLGHGEVMQTAAAAAAKLGALLAAIIPQFAE
jgi:purine-nucleoside phosphorylase